VESLTRLVVPVSYDSLLGEPAHQA